MPTVMGGWTRMSFSVFSTRTSARKCYRLRPSISCCPLTKTGMESSAVRSSFKSFSLTPSYTTMQPLRKLPTIFKRWTQIRMGIWSLPSCTSSTLGATTPVKRWGISSDLPTPMATDIFQCRRPPIILTMSSSTRPHTCIFRDGMSCRSVASCLVTALMGRSLRLIAARGVLLTGAPKASRGRCFSVGDPGVPRLRRFGVLS
mmetsp:Transcript_9935/g.23659  ORF Transcript_9935/g.23659 Transcript_9935/m.23659 type:complete len:202 (-) Transcript_9935:39-644(-)